jgi:hypothetical protein
MDEARKMKGGFHRFTSENSGKFLGLSPETKAGILPR